jgi:hypothetical protein
MSVAPRGEILVEPFQAPRKIATHTFAIQAETEGPQQELATARLVILFEPEGREDWSGKFRIVLQLRMELDPEQARDPFLAEASWSWLVDALETHGAEHSALGGTITVTGSHSFGDLAGREVDDDLQLRASWTPTSTDFAAHAHAFYDLIAEAAGLLPVGTSSIG